MFQIRFAVCLGGFPVLDDREHGARNVLGFHLMLNDMVDGIGRRHLDGVQHQSGKNDEDSNHWVCHSLFLAPIAV